MNRVMLGRKSVVGLLSVTVGFSGLLAASDRVADAQTFSGAGEFIRVAELVRERVPVRALLKAHYGFDDANVEALAENASVAVRSSGEVIFIDGPVPPPPPPPARSSANATTDEPTMAQSVPPSSQAFFLHSKPDAAKTLFLDFDGTVVGNNWATAGQPANSTVIGFDVDSQPATYTAAEQTFIRDTWLAVAEDYAPFDIDVTTEQPPLDRLQKASSSDAEFGTVLAISTNNFRCPGTCGGIAGLGVFGNYPGYAPGGWAFAETYFTRYPDGSIVPGSAAILADVISHEVGHTLGLLHDGKYIDKTANPPIFSEYYGGHGSWAPIMGSTNWYVTSQWSRGEYTDANRQEDDIAIIASTAGYSADEVGDTPGTATVLAAGNVVVDPGLINADADVDVFQFSTLPYGGRFRAQAIVNATSPDLDARLELRTSGGVFVTSSDPAGTASPTIDVYLGPGPNSYYLSVSGEAYLGPVLGWSGYGSIGRYELRVDQLFAPSTPLNPGFQGYAPNAQISWLPSTLPGGGPLSYTAKLCLWPAVTTCTTVVAGAATSASFPNVTPGISYVGSVIANNGFADSPPATLPVTVLRDPPGPPLLQSIAVNDATITLSWIDGDLRGNSATGYDVEATDVATGATSIFAASSPYAFADFIAGHRYGFRLRTKAAPGPGDWGSPRYAVAPGRVDAPQAPTSSTLVPPTRPPAPQTPTTSTLVPAPPSTRGPAPQA